MKKIQYLFAILFLWFVVHQIVIVIDGITSKPLKSEYAVILGNKVNVDGSLSKRLEARVLKGLELYNDSLVNKIFVSGGLGKEGFYEAQKMADFLLANGVDKQAIVIDDYGNNSWLTASNFYEIEPNGTSIIIVSQFFHLTRCKLAFKKLGFKNISAVSPNYFETRDFYALFREFFGFYKYLILN